MPRSTINFDTVRKIGLALPGLEASTAWGAPALKLGSKLMACVPTHRSAEPNSLMVRVDFDDRAELLSAAPDVYYVTDHGRLRGSLRVHFPEAVLLVAVLGRKGDPY